MSLPSSKDFSNVEAVFCYIPPKRIGHSRPAVQKSSQKSVSQGEIRERVESISKGIWKVAQN